ncbi:uncharacterized protein LOC135172732 isoform X2 [Diachasmimorpha longicaudata]|uniref:uncharacterized protein LOC135172732 isoform X2 n=1 Tax=Diachasmimorpha longicaudata TaxID=58733 RepID=UPI0030B8F333
MKSTDRKRSMKPENVHVLPSPVMLLKNSTSGHASKSKRASVKGLNEICGGGIPRNSAVHFSRFYDSPATDKDILQGTRSKFTGQMLHKLESLSGTKDYSAEVAAMIRTVSEPPNFSFFNSM